MTIVTIGIDLGKSSCSVVAMDAGGAVVSARIWPGDQLQHKLAKYVYDADDNWSAQLAALNSASPPQTPISVIAIASK